MPPTNRQTIQGSQRAEQMRQLEQLQRQQQQQEQQQRIQVLQRQLQQLQQQQSPQQQQQNQPPPPPQIIFARGHPPDNSRGEGNRVIVIIPEELYKRFIRLVYLWALFFILIYCTTCLVISTLQINLRAEVPVPFYVWLLLGFVLMIILQCCPKTQRIYPLNWILVILIVLTITLTSAYAMDLYHWKVLLTGMAISFVLVALFHVLGALCPQTWLPGGLLTGCLMLFMIVAIMVFLFLMIFMRDPVYCLVFFVLLLAITLLGMPYHAQFIHGRLQAIPLFTMGTCALSVFIDFIICALCISIFFLYYIYATTGVWFRMWLS
ncbi:uncharacterized protein LOC6576516 [Drosophila mojavensis]|uniref:uncharacterized protein LOC6576516 n=1 Tax=Drosophila mojavensis TaxID=7230 RepID=UPI00017C8BFA|nr:uncharacterized protein LOC6576516 [Drosophila mojavensis]